MTDRDRHLMRLLRDPYRLGFLRHAAQGGEEAFARALNDIQAAFRGLADRRAAIEAIKEARKGRTLGGISLKVLRNEGRP
jgi:Xaa-Pro aminopeptidase